MSWSDLTVVEIKRVLNEEQIEQGSARLKSQLVKLCENNLTKRQLHKALLRFGKLEDTDRLRFPNIPTPEQAPVEGVSSLAASHKAREAFLKQQKLGRRSVPTSFPSEERIRKKIKREESPIVRTAGRFSVASDDAISSPKSLSHPKRRTPQRQTSLWPAVDPDGNPIRWQIRAPSNFNSVEDQSTPGRYPEAHPPSKEKSSHIGRELHLDNQPIRKELKCKSMKTVLTCRWKTILALSLLVGILASLLMLPSLPFVFPLPQTSIFKQIHGLFKPLYFCDTSIPTAADCIPCPNNAICSEGTMECRKPQFRKEWKRGSWSCVKDDESYRIAYKMLASVADFLTTQSGLIRCDLACHPDGQVVYFDKMRVIGFKKSSLIKIVSQSQGVSYAHPAWEIVFVELINSSEEQARYKIWITDEKSSMDVYSGFNIQNPLDSDPFYISLSERKPLRCRIREIMKRYWLEWTITLLSLGSVVIAVRRWKLRKSIDTAIRRIVLEKTSIIRSSTSEQGYAIGPRAQDILSFIKGGQRLQKNKQANIQAEYPEYKFLSRSLTERLVEQYCDQLVKLDPSFCRSILAVDMIPFYYSKKAIDKIRSNWRDGKS